MGVGVNNRAGEKEKLQVSGLTPLGHLVPSRIPSYPDGDQGLFNDV